MGVANYNSVIRPNYNSVIRPNYNSVIRPKMTIYHQQHFDSPNLYSHRLSDTIYHSQDSRLLIPFNLYDSGLSPNYNKVIRNPRYYNVIPITIVAFELPIKTLIISDTYQCLLFILWMAFNYTNVTHLPNNNKHL